MYVTMRYESRLMAHPKDNTRCDTPDGQVLDIGVQRQTPPTPE